jgi:peptidoglycan/xylan/chitin deacetylase (PgdA/CDA1 family)
MRSSVALVAALTLAVAVVGTAAREPGRANVEAMVNSKQVILPPRSNVGEALLQARTLPRSGVLRSVVTHSTIDPNWDAGRVLLDKRRGRLDQLVRNGDRIQVTNGVDAVESTVERAMPVQLPGGTLPDVEREVWTPGVDGVARATVGERSGEVVQQHTMRSPVAASRVPGPVVALSFDDGPDPTFTPQVLQILANAGIKATFCVIGRDVRRFPDLLRTIAQQGHAICNHTESHPHLNRLTPSQVEAQFAPVSQLIRDTAGVAPAFVRAPYGDLNGDTVAVAHKLGLRVLGWSVDPSDYLKPPADRLAARVVGAVKPGSVVLMHDGGEGQDRAQTVAALPVIIEQLRALGYTFVLPPTAPPSS